MPELNPYARFLDSRPVLEILAATPSALTSLAKRLGPAALTLSPGPGKWSPTEILCHLADCEIAFAFRLRQTLAEEHHVLQPFDQDAWASGYSRISAEQALAAFSALRVWNLILIQNTPPEAWSKPVTHPERGTMTFSTIVETMAGHDLNHLAQVQRLAH